MADEQLVSPLSATVEEEVQELLAKAICAAAAWKGNVQFFHRYENVLTIVAQKGFTQEFLRHFRVVRPFDPSACGRAIGVGMPVVIRDALVDPGFLPYRDIILGAGIRGIQSIPLRLDDNSFTGVLSLHYDAPLSTTDIPAGALAIATEIATLLQQFSPVR